MARTLFISGDERDRALPWYQWEFLRRNRKYGSEFAEFEGKFGEWLRRKGHWIEVEYSEHDQIFFLRKIVPGCRVICQKWLIRYPTPPDWDFDRFYGLHEYKKNRFVTLPTGISRRLAQTLWNPNGKSYVDFIKQVRAEVRPRPPRVDLDVLTLELDLNKPMGELLRTARQVISVAKAGLSESPPTSISRRRFADYDKQLEIYDLLAEGRGVKEVALAAYANHFRNEDSLASLLQRARDLQKAASRLIGGGYQGLS